MDNYISSEGASHPRRSFLKSSGVLTAGILFGGSLKAASSLQISGTGNAATPAILGGEPLRRAGWIKWPVWKPETDEQRVVDVIRSGIWSRAAMVTEFEKEWAAALGVKRSLAVVNGTNALIVALNQLNIRTGDEILVPPYTFIATVTSVLSNGAMPVFVDIDPETYQMDPAKIEAKITPRTKAIMPVHILGLPCDMDRIMAIARKHNLVVVEDACQAHLAEYGSKKVGTIGNAGCFSFQNSKNLPIGEGGAVVSNDDDFMDRCFAYQNYGFPATAKVGTITHGSAMQGTKVRLTEYQAAIGLSLLKRLDEQTTTRNINAAYLKSQLKGIPGIKPYKLYDKVTRGAFHLFPFRYDQAAFKGLPREEFMKALRAEGVPCAGGYGVLNNQLFLKDAFESKAYQNSYKKEQLNFEKYVADNRCPENEQLCKEAVWFTQNMLLGPKSDMDDIAAAISRIHANAEKIKKAATK